MRVQQLSSILLDPNRSLRERCDAADELGRLGPAAREAIPALREALKDLQNDFTGGSSYSYDLYGFTYYLREHAILALARIDPASSVDDVIPVMAELLTCPREHQVDHDDPNPNGGMITYISFPEEVVSAFGPAARRVVDEAKANPPTGIPKHVTYGY